MMRRQRRPLELQVRRADVATAAQRLQRGSDGMRVRVRPDGRVRARIPLYSRYSTAPLFKGTISGDEQRAVLRGTIVEAVTEVLVPRLFTGAGVFMGLPFVALLAEGQFTNIGLYVCGIGFVVLGGLGHLQGRLRRGAFKLHADQLEHALRSRTAN